MPWHREENSADSITYSNDNQEDVVYQLQLTSQGILNIHLSPDADTANILKYFTENIYSGFRQITLVNDDPAIIASRPLHTGSVEILKRILGVFDIEPTAKDIAMLPKPLVGVIMGSDSDLSTMRHAAEIIEEFGIPVEVTIVSAHRTPDLVEEYAKTAYDRGLRVIIAGAGGAAHLPGMVAANTGLPVEGVPVIPDSAVNKDGTAPLLSIVEMPDGVPVNTVGIGKAKNAGLAALQILATSRPELYQALLAYKEKMKLEVKAKAAKVEKVGWRDYNKLPAQPAKPDALLFGALALATKKKSSALELVSTVVPLPKSVESNRMDGV